MGLRGTGSWLTPSIGEPGTGVSDQMNIALQVFALPIQPLDDAHHEGDILRLVRRRVSFFLKSLSSIQQIYNTLTIDTPCNSRTQSDIETKH